MKARKVLKVITYVIAIAALLASIFSLVSLASADDGDNFSAAGKKVLQNWEQFLLSKKELINVFAFGIANDGVITGKEMIALNKDVDDFYDAKSKADEYLKFYNLKTATVLNEELVRMTKSYYHGNLLFKRDEQDLARIYFTRLTGRDIAVLKSGPSIAGGEIAIMIVMLILLVVAIFGILLLSKGKNYGGFMVFIGVVFFILLTVLLITA